ncbi:hypothetical protein ACFSRY_17485 [Pontibacter locisalis]|uniref:Uncharacterized protein n=1 Tax=Pontibacter locisalis TaxID=1719035 RepID=A0ABW5IPT1_9BACT
MDDFKIILYILAAVAYFLLTQWRKAFKSPGEDEEELPQPKRKRVDQDFPNRPVTSFEDILRELQPKAEKGKAVIESAREEVRGNVPPLAPVLVPERKYNNYEDVAPRALSWEKRAEAIEAAKNSAMKREKAFKVYEQEERKQPTNPYAALLKNPATVRDAVILTEIFNRKYS